MVNLKIDKNAIAIFSSTTILACIGLMTASTPLSISYAFGTLMVSSFYILGAIGAYYTGVWLWKNSPTVLARSFNKFFGEKPMAKPTLEAASVLSKPEFTSALQPDIASATTPEFKSVLDSGSAESEFPFVSEVEIEPASPMDEDSLSFDLPCSPVPVPDSPLGLFLPAALPPAPVPLPAPPVLPVVPLAAVVAPLPLYPRPPVLPLFMCNIPGFHNKGSIAVQIVDKFVRKSARLLGY